MMQCAKVEHRIEARIREGQLFRITLNQRESPIVLALEPFPRTFDLERVHVNAGNVARVELLQYDFNTRTSSAAYLQCDATVEHSAQTSEQGTFIETLHQSANAVVDQKALSKIELHRSALRSTRHATNGVIRLSCSTDRPAFRMLRSQFRLE